MERSVRDVVVQIDILYAGLRKTDLFDAEVASTINNIILHKGVRKNVLAEAWDEWFAKHGGK